MAAPRLGGIRLACALIGSALILTAAPAKADEEAKAAVRSFVEVVMSGDHERVGAMLAPEFQILRSDGVGYVKENYIVRGTPQIDALLEIADLVVTRHDDIMVVRYSLTLEESIRGRAAEAKAPRMTVFRRDGDDWLVVAHSNFARIE